MALGGPSYAFRSFWPEILTLGFYPASKRDRGIKQQQEATGAMIQNQYHMFDDQQKPAGQLSITTQANSFSSP